MLYTAFVRHILHTDVYHGYMILTNYLNSFFCPERLDSLHQIVSLSPSSRHFPSLGNFIAFGWICLNSITKRGRHIGSLDVIIGRLSHSKKSFGQFGINRIMVANSLTVKKRKELSQFFCKLSQPWAAFYRQTYYDRKIMLRIWEWLQSNSSIGINSNPRFSCKRTNRKEIKRKQEDDINLIL